VAMIIWFFIIGKITWLNFESKLSFNLLLCLSEAGHPFQDTLHSII